MVDGHFLTWAAAAYLVMISMAISVVDARRLIIPNLLNAAYAGGGLTFAVLSDTMLIISSAAGGILGFAVLLILRCIYGSATGREGLGFGDVKFMAGAGLWVGWQGLAPLLFIASLTALLFIGFRGAVVGCYDPQQKLPFGPFLCLGTLAVWIAQMTDWAPWGGLA